MEFIDILKNLLLEKGISKNRLANEIGISEGSIRSWENGKYPTIDKLIKISIYFDISADELLGLNFKNITQQEKELLNCYKKADPGTQNSIKKLLDIKEKNDKMELHTSKIG